MKTLKLKIIGSPKYSQYPEKNHPSSIFQELYKKDLKNDNKNKNLNVNRPEDFLNIIKDVRLKEEKIETDKDYLIKESKREVKLGQEMLYLYGNKIWKINSKKLGKIKLDKKIFLNPWEEKENQIFISKSKSNLNMLKLPKINLSKIEQTNITKPVNKNNENKLKSAKKIIFFSEGNTPKKKINDCGSNINNNDIKYKNDNNLRHSSKKITINNINVNNLFLIGSNSRTLQKSKQLNDISQIKKNKKRVINILNNINEELKIDEKKHNNYIRKNDYGCELSKLKIDYLKKHYFQ